MDMFAVLDQDADGKVDIEEIMQGLDVSREEAEAMMKQYGGKKALKKGGGLSAKQVQKKKAKQQFESLAAQKSHKQQEQEAAQAAAQAEEDAISVEAELSDEGEVEDEATAALRAELEPLKLSALQKRAAAEGVDEEKLDDALDGDNVKADVIGLILAAAAVSAAAAEAEEGAESSNSDAEGAAAAVADEQVTPATEPDDEAFDLETLPPAVRTNRLVTKHFGDNHAAAEACLAMAKGEKLSLPLQKALFRVGKKIKLEDGVMRSMIKQAQGVGVTPHELGRLEAAASAARVPKDFLTGFSCMAAENGGPGAMSVVLEASALLQGENSAVDNDVGVEAVLDLRRMVQGKKVQPGNLGEFICAITGAKKNADDVKFWTRFASDALTIPKSPECQMLYQLLLGGGVSESSSSGLPIEKQRNVLPNLIRSIARGDPPPEAPPPSEEDIAKASTVVAKAFKDSTIDEDEIRDIFTEADTNLSKTLTVAEITKVCIAVIEAVRDNLADSYADARAAADVVEHFEPVMFHFNSPQGTADVAAVFDPNGTGSAYIDEFVNGFPIFVAKLSGEELQVLEQQGLAEQKEAGLANADETETAEDSTTEDSTTVVGEVFDVEEKQPLSKKEKKAQKKKDKILAKNAAKIAKRKEQTALKEEKKKAKVAANKAKQRLKKKQRLGGTVIQYTGKPLAIPKGAIEFFTYLAQPGSYAATGLATVLYIAVNSNIPYSFALTMQHLITGTGLDSGDVANLLALTCKQKVSLEHAATEFKQLTDMVWAQHDNDMSFLCAHFSLQLEEFADGAQAESLVYEIGLGQKVLQDHIERRCRSLKLGCKAVVCRETYNTTLTVDREPLDETDSEDASLESKDSEVLDQPELDQPDTKPKKPKKTKKHSFHFPASSRHEDNLVAGDSKYGDCRTLAERGIYGRLVNTLSRVATADSDVGKEEMAELYEFAAVTLSPMYRGNAGLEGLIDGHWDVPEPESTSPVRNPAQREIDHFGTGIGSEAEDKFDNPLQGQEVQLQSESDLLRQEAEKKRAARLALEEAQMLEELDDLEADEKGGDDTDGLNLASQLRGGHDLDEASPVSPSDMRRFAAEFEPDFIEGCMTSLVEILMEQRQDCRVLPAFQQMISRKPVSVDMRQIFYRLAARQDVDEETIDAIIWMRCGGAEASTDLLQRMVAPAQTKVVPQQSEKGRLVIHVVRGTGLLKQMASFCAVRCEGHQRNTHVVTKKELHEYQCPLVFRVADRLSAVIECYIYGVTKKGKTHEPLGRVTFPLHVVPPDEEIEQAFTVEAMRVMEHTSGSLGELTMRLSFEANDLQPENRDLPTCQPVSRLVAAAQDWKMNRELIYLLEEAGAIVIGRARAALDDGSHMDPTLVEIEAQADLEAEQGLDKGVCSADRSYDQIEDRAQMLASARPMREKYMAAISFCMSKFLSINPAVMDIIGSTVNKFAPAPSVTGMFSAVALGTLGVSKKALPSLKVYLRDQVKEEAEKLLRAARSGKNSGAVFKQLQQISRGNGCAQARVAHVSEIVAQADSFSTAAALFRLKDGKGASEAEEIDALDDAVKSAKNDFIKAGVQNLKNMIWPAREESFDVIRELVDGDALAEQGLVGWESRAELALIVRSDVAAFAAVTGLVQMETFRAYLIERDKDQELKALNKLMAGDKATASQIRKLTPYFTERIEIWWRKASQWQKFQVKFMAGFACLAMFTGMIRYYGFHEGSAVIELIFTVLSLILFTGSMVLGVIGGVYFVRTGKPFRDMVQGPNEKGVSFLYTLAASAPDPEESREAVWALQMMLMGQEPSHSGLTFLRAKANKYKEKVPEAIEALNTMEYIFVMQQAGKATADLELLEEPIPWPNLQVLIEDVTIRLQYYRIWEALKVVKEKVKAFIFTASIHPWMKKYAMHAGSADDLLTAVEVPLAMIKNNEEELLALHRLHKGYRPDPAGLGALVEIVDRLVDIDKNGPSATNLQQALGGHFRTGSVKQVFEQLDKDQSGYLDKQEVIDAQKQLCSSLQFTMSDEELEKAFLLMDKDGNGDVSLSEFSKWWKSLALTKKQQKAKAMAQLEAAGLLESSPKPLELQSMCTKIARLEATIGLKLRVFEVLESMCPDDESFDCLEECFCLCELKRVLVNDKPATEAIVGLEAMCMVPPMLEGNEELGIAPNPEALKILGLVANGDPAAVACLNYLKQPETRRLWGMMTQQQRRAFMLVSFCVAWPMVWFSGLLDNPEFLAALNNLTLTDLTEYNTTSGSWNETLELPELEERAEPEPEPHHGAGAELAEQNNPSFFILGLIPMFTSLFVNLFGQRIANLVTIATVFVASAGTAVSAALASSDEWTPAKLTAVLMGLYTGVTATKVATSNVNFAYGVQGAAVGAVLSTFSSFIWRPRVLWLVPELLPYVDWLDMAVKAQCAYAGVWLSDKFRGIISVFATSAIGTMGATQVLAGYGVPGMDMVTLENLSSGNLDCGSNVGCWLSLVFVVVSAVIGTVNQFKMAQIDFSLPAISPYELFMHKIDKALALLFTINEFIENSEGMSMDDIMDKVMEARDKFVVYISLGTNLMQFGLCFGFVADFVVNWQTGVWQAVPWAGAFSLLLAIITPLQGGVGVVSDFLSSPLARSRILEVVVPKQLYRFSQYIPILGQESFIVKFEPLGKYMRTVSFYMSTVSSFVAATMVAITYLTADMFAMGVKSQWAELQNEMPDFDMDTAMLKVSATVGNLGDSCAGLTSTLVAGITAASYDLGGIDWLIVQVCDMEKFFVMNLGLGLTAGSAYLVYDMPPVGQFVGPMIVSGLASTAFGLIRALPYMETHFTDLTFIVHRAQLGVSAMLTANFVLLVVYARDASGFIERNWDQCEIPELCEIAQQTNFTLREYAKEKSFTKEELNDLLKPLFYACAASCLSTMSAIVLGSNVAKFMYYKKIMSQAQEAMAKQSGGTADAVEGVLNAKMNRAKEDSMAGAAAEMEAVGTIKLEEQALMMELATGVPMEEHYDIAAHDKMEGDVAKAKQAPGRKKRVANTDSLASELDMASGGNAAVREANQLKKMKADLKKMKIKLERAQAVVDAQKKSHKLAKQEEKQKQKEDKKARKMRSVDEAAAEDDDTDTAEADLVPTSPTSPGSVTNADILAAELEKQRLKKLAKEEKKESKSKKRAEKQAKKEVTTLTKQIKVKQAEIKRFKTYLKKMGTYDDMQKDGADEGDAVDASAEAAEDNAGEPEAEAESAPMTKKERKAKAKADKAAAKAAKKSQKEDTDPTEELTAFQVEDGEGDEDDVDVPVEFVSARREALTSGTGGGVAAGGRTLSALARKLKADGTTAEFHDDRSTESVPLETRLQGAKALLGKTREANMVDWGTMDIFAKRTAVYTLLEKDDDSSLIDMKKKAKARGMW